MFTEEINNRYGKLAEETCCLSCGGAINYSNPKEGEICIDLGSGRGNDAIRLAEQVGKDGYVYGLDISDKMLQKATQTAEKLGISNVKFLKTELEKIDLESNIADLIISNCTINHAKNKAAVWNEIFRLLKNGGRFVISDIYSLSDVPEEYRNDPVAISECWAGAILKDEYLAIIQKANFKEVTIIEESKPYEKGKILVASFTVAGKKSSSCCSCNNKC
jgi:arsenite methyltransferase